MVGRLKGKCLLLIGGVLFTLLFIVIVSTNVDASTIIVDDDEGDFFSIKLGDPLAITLSSVLIVVAIIAALLIFNFKFRKKKK